MTTLGDIKRVIAKLSPDQRAQLKALVAIQPPAPEPPSPVIIIEARPPQSRPPVVARPTRDLVGPWRPLPRQPKQSDPLSMFR